MSARTPCELSEAHAMFREGIRRGSRGPVLRVEVNWDKPPEYAAFSDVSAPLFRDATGSSCARQDAVTVHPRPGAFAHLQALVAT